MGNYCYKTESQPLIPYRYTWTGLLSPTEIRQITPLYASAFKWPTARSSQYFSRCTTYVTGVLEWLIVYDQKKVVAFLSLHEHPDGILLANVVTIPSYRGRGIATEMLRKTRDRVHGERLYLQVLAEQPILVDFYSRRGFRLLPTLTSSGRYQMVQE